MSRYGRLGEVIVLGHELIKQDEISQLQDLPQRTRLLGAGELDKICLVAPTVVPRIRVPNPKRTRLISMLGTVDSIGSTSNEFSAEADSIINLRERNGAVVVALTRIEGAREHESGN